MNEDEGRKVYLELVAAYHNRPYVLIEEYELNWSLGLTNRDVILVIPEVGHHHPVGEIGWGQRGWD